MSCKIISLLFVFVFPLGHIKSNWQDKVNLEIINEDGSSKTIAFDWPYDGPPPVGSNKAFTNEIDKLLKKNGVDCPPKRRWQRSQSLVASA